MMLISNVIQLQDDTLPQRNRSVDTALPMHFAHRVDNSFRTLSTLSEC